MANWGCAVMMVLLMALPFRVSAGGNDAPQLVNHVVVIWMKPEFRNEAEINRLIAGHDMLRSIPGLVSLNVGRVIPSDRPIVDSSYDIASVFQFKSVEAMRTYLSHPTHVEFLQTYPAGKVERIQVYDFGG
jgi:hypothetical protein